MVWTVDVRRFSKTGWVLAIAAILAFGVAAGATVAAFWVGGISSTTLFLHALAFAGIAAALFRARRASLWSDKISGEIDAISGRLLRVEARLSEVDRQSGGGSRSTLAEVTGEIALLGNLVRDLTVTVASHDRDMAELAAELMAERTGRAEPAPPAYAEERAPARVNPTPARVDATPAWGDAPPARVDTTPAWGEAAPVVPPPLLVTSTLLSPLRGVNLPYPAPLRPDPPPEPAPLATAPPAPAPLDLAPLDLAPLRPASLRPAPETRPQPAPEPRPEPAPAPLPPLVASRQEPLASDVAETRRIAAMVEAFEADRIELHLQPVVSLPQRKVRFYEALARLRLADGSLLVPAEFLPLSERVGLVPELDRRVVARASAIARHLMARGSEAIVSCNLSPHSLAEAGFLRSVGRVLENYPDVTGRLVLEISQRCWRTLDAERAGALASLRDKGVPFALDRARDLRLDPLALADRGVRYVKLPADMLLRPEVGRGLDIEIDDLAAVLARAGIRLVAERVEREDDVPDLIDLDVPLAQGFVFAPPRAVRADVVGSPKDGAPASASAGAPTPASGFMPVSGPMDAGEPAGPAFAGDTGEERRPYRAFLRRAG